MGFTSKKKESKKKKGPKGKRARAKAKLERQWGETVDESQLPELRRGKSRLLAQQKQPEKQERATRKEEEGDDMDVYVSSEDDSDQEDQGALNRLLQSIKTRTTSRQQLNDQDDSEDESDSSDSESDGEMSLEDSHEDVVEESDVEEEAVVTGDDDDMASDIDPFASRFNREPLSEKELAQALSKAEKIFKVAMPNLESALEMQSYTDCTTNTGAATLLFPCNRKVLQTTWKRANAPVMRRSNKKKGQILSPLQTALYPSLATYKDAFVAAETRQVS
jgi:hypothetical protein